MSQVDWSDQFSDINSTYRESGGQRSVVVCGCATSSWCSGVWCRLTSLVLFFFGCCNCWCLCRRWKYIVVFVGWFVSIGMNFPRDCFLQVEKWLLDFGSGLEHAVRTFSNLHVLWQSFPLWGISHEGNFSVGLGPQICRLTQTIGILIFCRFSCSNSSRCLARLKCQCCTNSI